MAFGLTPSYTENFHLDDLSNNQFLVIANGIASNLGWKIQFMSDSGIIAYTNKGMFRWNAKITISLAEDLVTVKSESVGNEMFDMGRNRKTVTQFTNLYYDSKSAINAEELSQKYEELKPGFPAPENDVLSASNLASVKKFTFFSLFSPRKGFYITPILVDLNIAVFILMIISGANFFLPDNERLIWWGANFRPITLEGQWWRLITNCFVHIGIFHLLFNMYALLYIGVLLEPILGKTRFAAAYMMSGIIASVSSVYWHDLTISAGASGAIFGLYGVFLAMLTTNAIHKAARKPLLISIGIFVGYNLLNGMKGGIDNSAHIGGLISGLIIGYAYYPSMEKSPSSNLKYSIIGVLAVIALVISSFVLNRIPNDTGKYDSGMKKFVSMESMALEVYNLPQNTPKEAILSEIKDRGYYYWNENVKLLNDLDKLDLSTTIHERNQKLIEYCNLRIDSYHLIYKAINESTDAYQDSISYYTNQINALINGLKAK
jgi:rhomboid protease GluP